jgi:hypothetical protein
VNTSRYEVEVSYQKTRDDPEMVTVTGKYKAVNVALMACITDVSHQGMAPSKACDDGTFHLILVKKCSRLHFLRYLMRTAGRGVWHSPTLPLPACDPRLLLLLSQSSKD